MDDEDEDEDDDDDDDVVLVLVMANMVGVFLVWLMIFGSISVVFAPTHG